jgi:trigger factor
MQVTETLSEGLKRGFTVVVPGADIESRRAARLTDLSKTLRLPGFRPGKVPMPLVRQRYGTAVNAEVLEESVSEATQNLLSERKLRPALQPKIDVVNLDTGTGVGTARDLEFKVELELMPDIAAPDFSQIELTRRKSAATPEMVDRQMATIAERNRELVAIPANELDGRGGAEKGEALTVDFVGKLDGEPFPNGTGTDAVVEIGAGTFIPGFAEQLEGMKPGETRAIDVVFPAEYTTKDLAGKAATFDVTAKGLSRFVVPALDDTFAQKLAFDDLAEMRSSVQRRIQAELDAMARLRIKRQLLDALADRANFPAPQGLVDQEFNQIWQRVEAERKEGRLDDDDKDKDEATLQADYRAIAERRVRLGLLLAEIGHANNITVGDDEMTRAMRMEAARYPGQEARMMELFRKYPRASDQLRGPIFEDKVIDFVLELAKVTDQTVTPAELAEEPPMPGAAAAAAEAKPMEEAAEANPPEGAAQAKPSEGTARTD